MRRCEPVGAFATGRVSRQRPSAIRPNTYRHVRVESHPRARSGGKTIAVHVLVAEAALGRYLPDGVEVHHVDGNRQNNANTNLVICENKAYHHWLHMRARIVAAGGNPNTQLLCWMCRLPKDKELFAVSRRNATGKQAACRECTTAARKSYKRKSRKKVA
jgi:hypothetical protein